MSLEFLALRNFQRHKKKVFRFAPGITTITGATDSGKSAIIRGLQWVALNRPSGNEFIRTGEKQADALVCVDGKQVKRSRGSGVNTYGVRGDELKAFGNDVPAQVVELLRMGELNFQGQHDAPFWFSLGAGEVARQLNQVVDLGIIDDVLARIATRSRRAKTAEEICAERLTKAREKCKEMDFAEEMDVDLFDVEQSRDALARHQEREQLLGEAIEKLDKLSVPIEVPDLSELEALRERIDALDSEALAQLCSDYDMAENNENVHRRSLEKLEAEIKRRTGGKCPVCGKPL